MDDTQRIAKIVEAYAALTAALREVLPASTDKAAWAEVERHGATIHRQSRLLAGKSKGG